MFSKEHNNRDTDVGEGIFSGYFKEKPPEETGTTLTLFGVAGFWEVIGLIYTCTM